MISQAVLGIITVLIQALIGVASVWYMRKQAEETAKLARETIKVSERETVIELLACLIEPLKEMIGNERHGMLRSIRQSPAAYIPDPRLPEDSILYITNFDETTRTRLKKRLEKYLRKYEMLKDWNKYRRKYEEEAKKIQELNSELSRIVREAILGNERYYELAKEEAGKEISRSISPEEYNKLVEQRVREYIEPEKLLPVIKKALELPPEKYDHSGIWHNVQLRQLLQQTLQEKEAKKVLEQKQRTAAELEQTLEKMLEKIEELLDKLDEYNIPQYEIEKCPLPEKPRVSW